MLGFILGVVLTCIVIGHYMDSKQVVKRSWKQMTKIGSVIATSDSELIVELLKQEYCKQGEKINAYLIACFDAEKDRDYIEENKYTPPTYWPTKLNK